MAWRISGTYLEACNCDAICPCRRIGGEAGGPATYGFCEGALSWAIDTGEADGVDLAGLAVVLAIRYDEAEPGTPWDHVIYLDERADARQKAALLAIFTGELGGGALEHFPWAWKESRLHEVRSVPIEVSHHARKGFFHAGTYVSLAIGRLVEEQPTVTCVIPGHDRAGSEYVAEHLRVHDGPLAFELDGRCAYQSTFEYAG
jgi:hypothetical protein